MPTYEYRCLTCDERFEQRTSFATADEASCPNGHAEVKRLLSTFAKVGAGAGGASTPAPSGGGCCGGGCGCG